MPSLRSGITSGLGLCIRQYRYTSQLVRRQHCPSIAHVDVKPFLSYHVKVISGLLIPFSEGPFSCGLDTSPLERENCQLASTLNTMDKIITKYYKAIFPPFFVFFFSKQSGKKSLVRGVISPEPVDGF